MRLQIVAVLSVFVASNLDVFGAEPWIINMRSMQSPLLVGKCTVIELTVQGEKGLTPMRPDGRQLDWQDFDYSFTSKTPESFEWRGGDPRTRVLCLKTTSDVGATVIAHYPAKHLQPNQRIVGVDVQHVLLVPTGKMIELAATAPARENVATPVAAKPPIVVNSAATPVAAKPPIVATSVATPVATIPPVVATSAPTQSASTASSPNAPTAPTARASVGAGAPANSPSSVPTSRPITTMAAPPVGLGVPAVRPASEIGIPGSMILGGSQFDITLLRGGSAAGTAVVEKSDSSGHQKKHLGGLHYDPIVVESALGAPLRGIVNDFLSGLVKRHTGTLLDGVVPAGQQLDFNNSILSEVVFPAVDAESPERGKLRVTFVPEFVKMSARSSVTQDPAQSVGGGGSKGNQWSSRNFELTMVGVETQHVAGIEPITVQRVTSAIGVGELRDYEKQSATLEISNVIMTLSAANEASIGGWLNWYQDFVIRGESTADKEKSFTLALLSEDRKSIIATLIGSGVGILSVHVLPANKSSNRLYQVELYVEQLEYK